MQILLFVLFPVFLLWLLLMFVFPNQVTRFVILHVPGASWQQGDISKSLWQPAHAAAPTFPCLPKEGQIYTSDFRDGSTNDASTSLRILTMNVFLGHNLEQLLQEFESITPQPDVICLQEDNIFEDLESPGVFHHVGGAIAKKLRMQCFFVPTYFRERKLPQQPNNSRTNSPGLCGCYGLSILSKRTLQNVTTLPCDFNPLVVEKQSDILIGKRHFLLAHYPTANNNSVAIISVHFPSAGLFREKVQMYRLLQRQIAEISSPVIIAGDCNTFPRIASLFPWASTDRMFHLNTEAESWRHVVGGGADSIKDDRVRKNIREDQRKNFFDPFGNEVITGVRGIVAASKMDWIMFEKNRFVVEQTWKQQVKADAPIRELPSDHIWLMAQASTVAK